ncbi:unnamed protein product [Staurois parvus]|uniref:Uncharacterized protein n=1 Tax=Staurois parvus TaxID=386267 RepID=A0ABN9ELD2_9NEOB|nr:unnamed protein product [Staurois parvus]
MTEPTFRHPRDTAHCRSPRSKNEPPCARHITIWRAGGG